MIWYFFRRPILQRKHVYFMKLDRPRYGAHYNFSYPKIHHPLPLRKLGPSDGNDSKHISPYSIASIIELDYKFHA